MTAVIEAVRPVRSADAGELDAMVARCSMETRYRRFFAPVRSMPAEYREGVLAGDPWRHDALVAFQPSGQLMALASLVRADECSAELGVLVEDGWQRQGLGTTLVHELVARARLRGVPLMRATVLPSASRLLVWLGGIVPLEGSTLDADGVSAVYRLSLLRGSGG
jgi:GNAT superfamily N-acetyltransferase